MKANLAAVCILVCPLFMVSCSEKGGSNANDSPNISSGSVRLSPGRGAGPVRFGDSKQEVINKLGEPSETRGRGLNYASLGVDVWLSREGKTVSVITAGSLDEEEAGQFKGELPNGIRIGATSKELVEAYGEPKTRT